MLRRLLPLLSRITAGQLDAGLASLGSFAAGVYAVRQFTSEGLAAYALMFTAFLVVSQFSSQTIFMPYEVMSVKLAQERRLETLHNSLRMGGLVALVFSPGVAIGLLPVVGHLDGAVVAALAWTGALLASVSPIQDHLRRMFHLAGVSWLAASMSGIFLVTTAAAVFAIGRISHDWAPVGGLVAGNLASIAWGTRRARRQAPDPRLERVSYSALLEMGRWLLLVGLGGTGFSYLAALLLRTFAGVEALGFAEGARIVAQPLNVVSLGLIAVIGPRAMEAASASDRSTAVRWRVRYVMLLLFVAIPYAWIASTTADWSPLPRLLPNAYKVTGLGLAIMASYVINSLSSPWSSELMGARLEKTLGITVGLSGVTDSATVGLTAGLLGPFALPAGTTIGSLVRWSAFQRRLRRWYGSGESGRRAEEDQGDEE